jgi:hypothetical protein
MAALLALLRPVFEVYPQHYPHLSDAIGHCWRNFLFGPWRLIYLSKFNILLAAHTGKEINIGFCRTQLVQQKLHAIHNIHGRQNLAQDPQAIQIALFNQ